MRSSVTTAVDGCTNSPSDDAALADVAGERRHHDDVGDRLLGERQLRARPARARRARRARCWPRSPPGSAPRRRWSAGSAPPLSSASLRCAVVCASAFCDSASLRLASARCDRGARLVEPQVGVDRLDADQHGALRRRAGRRRPASPSTRPELSGRDVGRLVGLEAAGRFDDDRLVDALDRGDRHRGRRPWLGGRAAVSVPLQPADMRGIHATQAASAAGPMRTNSS